jgi:hypothetical protein
MDEIKYLIDIFKQYGFFGMTLVAICLILITMIKSEWIKKIYNKLTDIFVERFMKEKTKDTITIIANHITESDVINHDIFNYIDLWKYSRIPTIQLSTEYRTIVFRKYLVIFLKSYKDNLKSFLNSGDYKNMDNAQIWKGFLELVNRIIFDYEREMVEIGIPKVVIEKMKTKNNDTINLIIDLIEGICSSNFYESESNLLKVYSILNIILSVLDNTISNAEATCNSINGQLAGLSFNDGGRVITEPGKKH